MGYQYSEQDNKKPGLLMTITVDEYFAKVGKKKKKNKFKAVKTERDGKKFPSKLEAHYYDKLKLRQKAGDISYFLTQVPFFLPGNVKYVCDFQIFYPDGRVEYVDTKGKDTALSIAKRKIVHELYPVEIIIVKR